MLSQNIQHSVKPTKKKYALLIAGIALFAFLLISAFGFALWYKSTTNTQASKDKATKVFVIKSGEGSGDISKRLKDDGLINNYLAMILYLNQQKMGDKVQAGEYQIPGNLTIKEVANIITLGKVVTTKITIPEGWDIDKMGDYLAKNTTITKAEFEAAARYDSKRDSYEFLDGMTEGQTLEGFLYPDTYQLSLKPTANEVVEKMLKNFDEKLTAADREGIKKSGMTTFEVVTLASMVEREAVTLADRRLTAGVFENRLNIGMPLQSDVTVLYALKSSKKDVTWADTKVASPYNTYYVPGLPVGPICSPSIEAIEAVIFPAKSSYLYFLAAPNGKVYYSATIDGHNINKARYLK
jgi:UPF0755 protein